MVVIVLFDNESENDIELLKSKLLIVPKRLKTSIYDGT